MGNTLFSYLYRDRDYKNYGTVVFGGDATEAHLGRLRSAASDCGSFNTAKVDLSLLCIEPRTARDHDMHELDEPALEPTTRRANDPRTVEEFVQEFEAAAKKGWFSP